MRSLVERDVVIVACAISTGVHAALTPEHLREGAGAGLGFLVSASILAALCVALTLRPGSLLPVGAAALVLGGLVAAYALALTTGVPLLHPEPEQAEGLGLATKAVELLGLAGAIHLIASGRPAGRPTRLQPKGMVR